jgi:YHS domain-containing protein
VGNIPLGAGLWNAGISFGGTISFIFADLLSLPLILIYRKYYGVKFTYRLVALFWFTMSVAGLITEAIFKSLNILPTHSNKMFMTTMARFGNNRTTWLNALGLLISLVLIALYATRDKSDDSPFATDPICGMQVNKADAIHRYTHEGHPYYFCSPGCLDSFSKNPTLR